MALFYVAPLLAAANRREPPQRKYLKSMATSLDDGIKFHNATAKATFKLPMPSMTHAPIYSFSHLLENTHNLT